jgi:hypothetical protein
MTNGSIVWVTNRAGRRLFLGTFHWSKDGIARIYRRGHVTLVDEALVVPAVSN